MAVFEVLAEVISSIEFLGLVALLEFMDVGQMFDPAIPIGLGKVVELFTAVSTGVGGWTIGGLRGR